MRDAREEIPGYGRMRQTRNLSAHGARGTERVRMEFEISASALDGIICAAGIHIGGPFFMAPELSHS